MSPTPRFGKLEEWLTWQEQLHPREIDLGLARVSEVAERLGGLQPECPLITVAGTNGKGSCVRLLEGVYAAADYRVAAYTSPHLLRYNERIRIAGSEIDDASLCRAFAAIDAARGDISLSYFEFATLAALYLFRAAKPDVVVLEVGLGGRLDATNMVAADVAIVSSIGIDHQAYLGNDRDSIGREKAGIFRRGRLAICGDPEPPASIAAAARERGAILKQLGRDFRAAQPSDQVFMSDEERATTADRLPTSGLLEFAHQRRNLACVIEAVRCLQARLPVPASAVVDGVVGFDLPGRCQRLQWGTKRLVFDVAHNPQAAESLAASLASAPHCHRTAVFAIMADKDIAGVMAAMQGVIDDWQLCGLPMDRAASVTTLHERARQYHLRASQQDNIGDALNAAHAGGAEEIVVFGSFHTVAAVRQSLPERREAAEANPNQTA